MNALIKENVALAPLTTFRIGGPARYFIEAATEAAVLESVQFTNEKKLPLFVLGGGSNLLVSDAGFPGLVVKIAIEGTAWEADHGKAIARAGAGEDWDRFVAQCVERDLAGVECLSGIPGSVGGTPVQNVGAYGQEVSEVIAGVRAYDRETDSIVDLIPGACRFRYRESLFNTTARERYIVLQVTYALTEHGEPAIRYPDVQREFENSKEPATLGGVRDAVRRIRARKAMLLVEGDPDCRSAGSFFKNPILSESQFEHLRARAGHTLPRYDAGPGRVKTSAAWLIEHAGFSRGYAIGPAGISTKHTLAIVNKGSATAAGILRLAREIHGRVYGEFGVRLAPEPVFVGLSLLQ
ncbi:MAG TPA: UDP-N-acetylmuramate dehydrogenase [Terriglobia bacterium]